MWAFLFSWKMEVAGFCSVQRSKVVLSVLGGFLLRNALMVGYTWLKLAESRCNIQVEYLMT